MSNKYEVSTATLIDAIAKIPEERWADFCSELHGYMMHHKVAVEAMKILSDMGLCEFEEPKTMTWVDDDADTITVSVVEKNSGTEAVALKGKSK